MLFPSVRGASEGRQRVNPNPAPIPKVHTFSHRDSMGESVHLAIAGTLGVDWDSPTDAWCRKSSVSPPLRSSFTLLSRQKFQAPCMRTQSRVFPSSSFKTKVSSAVYAHAIACRPVFYFQPKSQGVFDSRHARENTRIEPICLTTRNSSITPDRSTF